MNLLFKFIQIRMNFNVEFKPDFLSTNEANRLYMELIPYVPFQKNKRSSATFGDKGIVYTINYFGQTVHRPTKEWIKPLLKIKERLEEQTKEKYNVCVLQCYPHGGVGINPHRDKEMVLGTMICGVSLGQERTLELSRGSETKSYQLNSGSLYILKPPTNSYWLHSIPKDQSKHIRLSLTFRNYSSATD